MYKSKKTGIIGVIITCIILIIIVVFSNKDSDVSIFENISSKIVMPIQTGITYIKNGFNKNEAFFADIDTLKKENTELKQKNSELEQSLRELENIKTQNDTLKEYLELDEKYGEYDTIPGYIINKDISNYSRVVVINIGSKDGVEKNMAVIADKGLVGHVISVTDSTAKIKTIIDTSSSFSSILSTTSETIVCRGTMEEKKLKATYIPTDVNIIQGDSVKTSGIGGIYPKGIHIGTVKEVVNTQNMIDRYAVVEPAVDFNKLNTILVIKNK